jgi:hypothetical protein
VALDTLARLRQPEDLPLLRELACAPDCDVAVQAIQDLASRCSREELEAFLIQHDQELCAQALAALDELLYMPEWLNPKNMEKEK